MGITVQGEDSPVYTVAAEVAVAAETAFNFLENPRNLGRWALGCFDTRPAGAGLYRGTSLFDGSEAYFRIEPHRSLYLLDFHLGVPEAMTPRISVRVVAAEIYGGDHGHCIVTISAWRDRGMDNVRWHRLCVCHETEIALLKSILEGPV